MSHEREVGGELVYRATDPEAMSYREQGDGGAILEGRMMPYGEMTEVKSSVEGHFMETFAPGALAKTMRERAKRIRALFEHGLDFLGKQPIATIDEFRDEPDGAYYSARLFRAVPELIIEGLRNGVYGSSIRFRPVPGKWERNRSPEPSERNPQGLPEHTIREAYVQEFSVVTFPQYEGATAVVRSITDEVEAKRLLGDPLRLVEYLHSARAETSEPQHSEPEEPADQAPEPSRSTQVTRDYLTPQKGDPSWRL